MVENGKVKKKKRARSKEDKANQFQEIKDIGRKLFVKNMESGLHIRSLASELDMAVSNLYNYVESIRELWIAIRTEDNKFLRDKLENVIDQHQGSLIELLEELFDTYLDFSQYEQNRFRMLYHIPPPKSKKVGPLEKQYKSDHTIQVLLELLHNKLDPENKNKREIEMLSYILYSIAYGAAQVIHSLSLDSSIRDPIKRVPESSDIMDFKNSIKKIIPAIIKSYDSFE